MSKVYCELPTTQKIEDLISFSDLWKLGFKLQKHKRHLAQAILAYLRQSAFELPDRKEMDRRNGYKRVAALYWNACLTEIERRIKK